MLELTAADFFGHPSRLVHVLRLLVECIISGTWEFMEIDASPEPAKRTYISTFRILLMVGKT